MKRRWMPVVWALSLIILIICGYAGFLFLKRYMPTKELADIEELFQAGDDKVAVVLNEELQGTQGLYVNGQTYLPVEWVNEQLNERFYWDNQEKLMVYTLPESIVYANAQTIGASGHPLLWVTGEQVYLSIGLIANYTDIRMSVYDQGDIKRVYINNTWEPETRAEIKRNGNVRVKGGIKSSVVTPVLAGETVIVTEQMENWSRVRTEDGYFGYIENKKLENITEETPVSDFEAPVYTSISMDEKVVLGWHQMTNMDGNDSLDAVIDNTKGMNVISPTWFALSDNEGNYRSLASREYVDRAHERGIQVWALIDNFSSDVQTEVLMSKTSTRKKLIESLMKDVETYNLDGINLDFEGIKEEAGVHYVQFIRELSVSCRKEGIVLSVDNYVPLPYNAFYNRKEQGIVTDYVIVMGYDEHYSGGEMGTTASISYVRNGIAETLKEVPKEKVINAIPFYTRVWTDQGETVSSKALGIKNAKAWVQENQVELYWQEELGQYYGEHQGDEGMQYIWLEEEKSIGLKMEEISKADIAGVACWKLGFEPEGIWDIIMEKME